MKLQEIFDKAFQGVVNQGGPGHNRGACAYIGTVDGKEVRCALGHLVKGLEVHKIENINQIIEPIYAEIEPWMPLQVVSGFMYELRNIHDNAMSESCDWAAPNSFEIDNEKFMKLFKEDMKSFAEAHDLVFHESK